MVSARPVELEDFVGCDVGIDAGEGLVGCSAGLGDVIGDSIVWVGLLVAIIFGIQKAKSLNEISF